MLPSRLALECRRVARRTVGRQRTRNDAGRAAFPRPDDAELARQFVAFVGKGMLVCERRCEVELVVRAPRQPVAQSRERVRRVEVAVQQAVGLRLVARAVVHVGGQLVAPAELVGGAAG